MIRAAIGGSGNRPADDDEWPIGDRWDILRDDLMETILGLLVVIGLSAASGLRVSVPLLGMSIAAVSGYIPLTEGFEWIGTWPALIAFATASILEIAGYYIPWVDNLMDTISTPAAVIAGTVLTASMIKDVSPFLKWSLAIIGGGGTAGAVQLGTVLLRGKSSALTGGLGNFALSTVELIGSIVLTLLAILIPLLGFVLVIFVCYKLLSFAIRKRAVAKLQNEEAQK